MIELPIRDHSAEARVARRTVVADHRELARPAARRDALTGLANRRAFDERLEAALLEAAAVRRQLSVIFFDLDAFERFNDAGGRAHGDAVLAHVARAASRVLRAGEELFRVGGDEFAVIIDGGPEAGRRVAARVQAVLRAQTSGTPLPTISAGVATFPLDGRGGTELLTAAERTLRAQAGR